MNAQKKLRQTASFLRDQGISDYVREAELLITGTLHTDKSTLYADNVEIPDDLSSEIDSRVTRRARGEPIQYIFGHVEFFGMQIVVGPGVLIPRPETELVVDEAIRQIIRQSRTMGYAPRFTILDLCTGSGCIAVTLAKQFPQAVVYGVDMSEKAIQYAVQNATANNATNAAFIVGNLFEPLGDIMFDFIVANPPYVKRNDIKGLQREIREYEPMEALDGGEDGLDFYRKIFQEGLKYLKKGGMLILEIGFGQADEIKAIAASTGFKDICFMKDYAGILRIAVAR